MLNIFYGDMPDVILIHRYILITHTQMNGSLIRLQ